MKPRLQKGKRNILKISGQKRVFFKKCAETFIYMIVFHPNVMSVPNNVYTAVALSHDKIYALSK